MAFNIYVDDELAAVLVKTEGDLKAEEFHEMIIEGKAKCEEASINKVLVDHTASTVKNISSSEVHGIAMMCSVLNDVMTGGRLAVVLIYDVDYGMGRMWESYTINKLEYDSRLFRNVNEAREWLKNE